FAITRELPIPRDAFQRFLHLLSMSAGPRLLRVKGLVHDRDEPERPRVIHAVQHVVYPPAILDGWPSADRCTRLVFMTRSRCGSSLKPLSTASRPEPDGR
ncbi:MAG: GTP-binding protein, partial [Mesorhizobium sp.]